MGPFQQPVPSSFQEKPERITIAVCSLECNRAWCVGGYYDMGAILHVRNSA
jgi:hypothetical protein